MKSKYLFALFLPSLLVSLFGASLSVSAGVLDDVRSKGELVVSTDTSYAPQSFLNENGELIGFDVDVAKEVAERLGVKVRFVTPSWSVVVGGGWGAGWDVSIGSMTITEERKELLDFSIPYYYAPAQFAVHKDDQAIKTLADFSGKTVGVGIATTYETYLNPNMFLTLSGGERIVCQVKGVNAKTYPTDMWAIQDLALGDGLRLDGVLSSQYVIFAAMKRGIPIKPVGAPVYYEPIAAASDKARPGSAEFIETISQILQAMHDDGTLGKLALKWYGVHVTRKTD